MATFSFLGNLFGKGRTTIEDMVGDSIHIAGRRIIVDGKTITNSAKGVVELKITEGVVHDVTSEMAVTCGEVTGDVNAGMSVNCGNVGGNVDGSMSVTCRDIAGNAKSGMSLSARNISGKTKSGM